jgi:hypothetical protein
MKFISLCLNKFASFFVVILLVLSINSTVFAATAYGSWGYMNNVYGYSYKMRNKISTGVTYVSAYVEILCTTTLYCPAGYMGAKARLFSEGGALVIESSWYYNNEVCAGIGLNTITTGVHDESYYSDGITRAWNGTGYWTYGGVPSPSLTY